MMLRSEKTKVKVKNFFIVPQRLTLVSNAKTKISKSNKSELWNRLTYRGLPYVFNVGRQTFKNDYQILRLRPRKFVIISESLAANLEKVRQASV